MPVRVDGMDEAIDLTEGMEQRSTDLSPVLEVIASDLSTFVDTTFAASTDPEGQEWRDLAPLTKELRRGTAPYKPLIDTGTLRNSITATHGARSILIGTNVPYAGFHQFGTVDIPERQFLPFNEDGSVMTDGPIEEEWQRYETLIAHYIETGEILEG